MAKQFSNGGHVGVKMPVSWDFCGFASFLLMQNYFHCKIWHGDRRFGIPPSNIYLIWDIENSLYVI